MAATNPVQYAATGTTNLLARLWRAGMATYTNLAPLAFVTSQTNPVQAAVLLVEACANPSNLETDWLWLAAQMVQADDRRFCFEQALRINPASSEAKRALRGFRV